MLVEDETLVAMFIEEILSDLGCEVVATAWRVGQALKLCEVVEADAAVLDVNIAGERVYPVAEALKKRNIPLVFATGYGSAGIPDGLGRYPVLTKPIRPADLEAALRTVLDGGG